MELLWSCHPLLNLHLNQVEAFSQAHVSHHLHQLQIATTPLDNILVNINHQSSFIFQFAMEIII